VVGVRGRLRGAGLGRNCAGGTRQCRPGESRGECGLRAHPPPGVERWARLPRQGGKVGRASSKLDAQRPQMRLRPRSGDPSKGDVSTGALSAAPLSRRAGRVHQSASGPQARNHSERRRFLDYRGPPRRHRDVTKAARAGGIRPPASGVNCALGARATVWTDGWMLGRSRSPPPRRRKHDGVGEAATNPTGDGGPGPQPADAAPALVSRTASADVDLASVCLASPEGEAAGDEPNSPNRTCRPPRKEQASGQWVGELIVSGRPTCGLGRMHSGLCYAHESKFCRQPRIGA